MNQLIQRYLIGGSTAALAAVMPAFAAFAQDQPIEQVVVSASRITIAGYSQPTPVTVVGAEQLQRDAYANIADAISILPQVTTPPSDTSAAQSGGTGGNSGANIINLRNLGVTRTLILFDGQRVVASNIFGGGVDITVLPSALISRVDVVTGGASAAWGSDAVAGVVNFVLNKNFTGFKATVQGSDTTDGLDRDLSLSSVWGGDVFGGRGHIELAVSAHMRPDTVLETQEKWFRGAYWVSNPAYAAGNGQPQLIVANNVGVVSGTEGGIISASPAGVAGPGVTAAAANALRGIQFVGSGVPQLVNYGNLTLNTLSNGGSMTDRNGQEPWTTISLPNNTYTLFGYARYKLTDTIQASLQLNYSYFTEKGTGSPTSQTALAIKSDNAYIPASVASAMQNGGITSFTMGIFNGNNYNNYTATGATYFSQAEAALGPGSAFNRRILDRGVFTLDGTLGDNWSWNAYIQHSQLRYSAHMMGDPIAANLQNAQDAVTVTSANVGKSGLALGSIACRSTLTGTPFVVGSITAQPGCVPLDVFGEGVASPAAIAYVNGFANNTPNFTHQSLQQEVAEGSMQGTLPWELPAGKIAVAFGVGYRKEAAVANTSSIAALSGYGATDYPPFPSASYNVLEGFGEVAAPILKNNIVDSLDFTMAGRMTSYSTSGLVETWKLGATAQVNDDIKLRTTWSVDIRAPQLSDLFTQGLASVTSSRDPKTQSTVPVFSFTNGNPNLLPEVARTISGGAVLTPTFIPGLSLSADWYSINVTGELASVSAATILNQCNASLPSTIHPGQNGNPNDPLCNLLVFGGPNGALSAINVSEVNINSQTVSGLDLQANYTMDFWDGSLAWSSIDSYTDENTVNATGAGAGISDSAGSGGLPKWRGLLSATYTNGPYAFTVQSRWFGTSVFAQNANSGNQSSAAVANLYDPAHFEVPFTAYLDLRGNYKWNDNISFFGAIDNVLNNPPALVAPNSGKVTAGANILPTNFNIYDLLGRVVRVGVRFNY